MTLPTVCPSKALPTVSTQPYQNKFWFIIKWHGTEKWCWWGHHPSVFIVCSLALLQWLSITCCAAWLDFHQCSEVQEQFEMENWISRWIGRKINGNRGFKLSPKGALWLIKHIVEWSLSFSQHSRQHLARAYSNLAGFFFIFFYMNWLCCFFMFVFTRLTTSCLLNLSRCNSHHSWLRIHTEWL